MSLQEMILEAAITTAGRLPMETPSLQDSIAYVLTAFAMAALGVGVRLARRNEKNGIGGRMKVLETRLDKSEEQKRMLMLGMDTLLEWADRMGADNPSDHRWESRLADTRRRIRGELES